MFEEFRENGMPKTPFKSLLFEESRKYGMSNTSFERFEVHLMQESPW